MDPKLLPVISYLQNTIKGNSNMKAETIKEACNELIQVLNQQFNHSRPKFRIRASNIGQPFCKLWHEKNGTPAAPLEPSDIVKFLIGDLTEVVLKAILREAFGEDFKDGKRHSIELENGKTINGSSDVIIKNEVDDIKSASQYAFNHKFQEYNKLRDEDSFGYIGQLIAYTEDEDLDPGGWWAVNKVDGQINYLKYEGTEEEKEKILAEMNEKVKKLNENAPFEKGFTDEPETYYKKESGNRILSKSSQCRFCKFRYSCWPDLVEHKSVVSKSPNPPIVQYTKLNNKEFHNETKTTK